jgi:hypothetical protein
MSKVREVDDVDLYVEKPSSPAITFSLAKSAHSYECHSYLQLSVERV